MIGEQSSGCPPKMIHLLHYPPVVSLVHFRLNKKSHTMYNCLQSYDKLAKIVLQKSWWPFAVIPPPKTTK